MSASHIENNENEMYAEEHRYVGGAGYKAVAAYGFDGTNMVPLASPVVSVLTSGRLAVTATPTALASNALVQGVIVEALAANTISVFIGPSTVTITTGIELPPGAAVTLPVNNSNLVYAVASTTGASVTFVGA